MDDEDSWSMSSSYPFFFLISYKSKFRTFFLTSGGPTKTSTLLFRVKAAYLESTISIHGGTQVFFLNIFCPCIFLLLDMNLLFPILVHFLWAPLSVLS